MNGELERPDMRADTKEGKAIRRDLGRLVDELNIIIKSQNERLEKLEKRMKEKG